MPFSFQKWKTSTLDGTQAPKDNLCGTDNSQHMETKHCVKSQIPEAEKNRISHSPQKQLSPLNPTSSSHELAFLKHWLSKYPRATWAKDLREKLNSCSVEYIMTILTEQIDSLHARLNPIKDVPQKTISSSPSCNAVQGYSAEKAICHIEATFVIPRGKLKVTMFPSYLAAQKQDQTMFSFPWSHITHLVSFVKPGTKHQLFLFVLAKTVPHGKTSTKCLLCSFGATEKSVINSKLLISPNDFHVHPSANQLCELFKNTMLAHSLFACLLNILQPIPLMCGDQSIFSSSQGLSYVKCYNGVNDGFLYPLPEGLAFIHRPLLFLPLCKMEEIQFARGGSANNRYFDLQLCCDDKNYSFTMIERAEQATIARYVEYIKKQAAKKPKPTASNRGHSDKVSGVQHPDNDDNTDDDDDDDDNDDDDDDDNDDDDDDNDDDDDEDNDDGSTDAENSSDSDADSDYVPKEASDIEEDFKSDSEFNSADNNSETEDDSETTKEKQMKSKRKATENDSGFMAVTCDAKKVRKT